MLSKILVPVDDRPIRWILRNRGIVMDGTPASIPGAVAGALAGGGLFYAIGEALYRLGGKEEEYLGFGDLMLISMVGTFFGVPLTMMTILLGSLGGSILAVAMSVINPKYRG